MFSLCRTATVTTGYSASPASASSSARTATHCPGSMCPSSSSALPPSFSTEGSPDFAVRPDSMPAM